jgi:hypothetical protein
MKHYQSLFYSLSSQIVNIEKPICNLCVHFISPKSHKYQDYDYKKMGKCGFFGNKNLVTGKIEYDFAIHCRTDKKKCGEYGRYFIRKYVKLT